MTDPTGRSFLSYRRVRIEEAKTLIRAQHDVGIPTWQDVDDLRDGYTEPLLKEVLSDVLTANVVLFITPELETSAVVQKVEIPSILTRVEAKDKFFVAAIVAGGLDYDTAGRLVKGKTSIQDLRNWNLRKVNNDPITYEDAAQISQFVLQRRLQSVHAYAEPASKLKLGLFTRSAPGFRSGYAVLLNWAERFTERNATPEDWKLLLTSLKTVVALLQKEVPRRELIIDGLATISACVALGRALMAPTGLLASWTQRMPVGQDQLWSLGGTRENSDFRATITPATVDAADIAVLVSVTTDVTRAFRSTTLPDFRAVVHLKHESGIAQQALSSGQALDLALTFRETLNKAQVEYGAAPIHLFMAVPIGLAFLIGQLLNTFGPVHLYEHSSHVPGGTYIASVELPAS